MTLSTALVRRLAMQFVRHHLSQRPDGRDGSATGAQLAHGPRVGVLDLLTSGATTEDIARVRVLSTETVRPHRKKIYRERGVRCRDEAVEAAFRIRAPSGVIPAA